MCLDTCHVYAAGYDIATTAGLDDTLKKFDKIIGLKRLKAIHLNDSKGTLGSHLDRHEHIGEGRFKKKGIERILSHPKLRDLPFIMETPKKDPRDDIRNIKIARRLSRSR